MCLYNYNTYLNKNNILQFGYVTNRNVYKIIADASHTGVSR